MHQQKPQTIYLKDYRPPDFLIDKTDLKFELGENSTLVIGQLSVRKNPAAGSHQRPLILNGEGLKLKSVSVNGTLLDEEAYQLSATSLTIPVADEYALIKTEVEIFPDDNSSLEGLYRSNGIYCTQCEAEGFRKITYFLDRPDVMSEFTTTLIAAKDLNPILLSNGNRIDAGILKDGRHWVRWHDPYKKPSYLFALVAGDLSKITDTYKTLSGRSVALEIYVEPQNLEKCGHAMTSLQKAMRWDEQEFCLEYDLDTYMIVAVDHFNMGAMENKGLNIFNSKFVLAKPETATDADFAAIEGVIAHEYFHNWTGNRVTCRDWFQLSLKEGLTVFRDQEFSSDMQSRSVKRIEDIRLLKTVQFAEDASPMAHPVRPESYIEINNFYTVTIYEKGAEVIRMLHTLLGDAGFKRGMQLYFERHDGQAVTCDDFVAAMADANKMDLTQFKLWYSQAGTPEIEVESHWNGEDGIYSLTLTQSLPDHLHCDEDEPLLIPVKFALLDEHGWEQCLVDADSATPLEKDVLFLDKKEQTFRFRDLQTEPKVSLFRGFSAPVKVKQNLATEDLAFLASHDRDPFNRWDASQKLWLHHLLRLFEMHQRQTTLDLDAQLVDFCAVQLRDDSMDPAFVALILTPPSPQFLIESVAEIDIEAIDASLRHIRSTIAKELSLQWKSIYEREQQNSPYQFNRHAVAKRSLKNLALAYWAIGCEQGIEVAEQQFRRAENMTDRLAALSLLVNEERANYQSLLEEFYFEWKTDPLVLDKWFSLQASSRGQDTFARVKELYQHDDFTLKNPNRVRSLLGVFSRGNLLRFHEPTGEAYQFFTDQVLILNEINPQVASRLLVAFGSWARFNQPRKDLMKAQLERILAQDKLSSDVYEIVSKYLA